MQQRLLGVLAGGVAAVALSACGPSHINTIDGVQIDGEAAIVDTNSNREVLQVVSEYHDALERRDGQLLELLVSDDYYENSGTAESTEDDYGRASLAEVLSRFTDAVQHLTLEITVKDLRVEGDRAQVFYEYTYNCLYKVGEVPRWDAGRDVNRMDLVRTSAGAWKITRGL